MTPTCAEIRDLAPAFVLGALEASEMAAVRAHLATCAEAHEELEQLGGVVAYLGEAIEPVEPSAALKDRIMAAAGADLAPSASATERHASADEREAPGGVEPTLRGPAPVVEFRERTSGPERPSRVEATGRRPRSVGAWTMRLAAVLAIVVLGASTLYLQGRLDASERYAQAVARVVAAAAEPGSQTAILSGEADGPRGIAAVAADGSIVLAMQDLAPTSGTEVYEAWVIVGDAGPVPVGGFTVGGDGTGSLATAPTAAVAGATLALTLEPASGATTPTLPIVSAGVAVAPPG